MSLLITTSYLFKCQDISICLIHATKQKANISDYM